MSTKHINFLDENVGIGENTIIGAIKLVDGDPYHNVKLTPVPDKFLKVSFAGSAFVPYAYDIYTLEPEKRPAILQNHESFKKDQKIIKRAIERYRKKRSARCYKKRIISKCRSDYAKIRPRNSRGGFSKVN